MKTSAGLYDAVVFTAGSTVTNNGGSLSLTPVDADKVRVLLAGGAKMVQASGETEMGRKLVSLGAHNQANGFIDVSGGTLHLSAAQVQLGTGNASGTITVSGGEVENAGTMQLGFDTFSGAGGWLNLSAGTWRQVNGGLVAVGDKRGETSAINVTGTGAFFTTGNVVLGQTPYYSELAKASGVLLVDGGSFTATNAAGDAALTLKRGTLRIRNGGTLAVDSLATGDSGADAKVDFTGGALAVGTATISNTLVTVVGNGVDAATLSLGAGPHLFFDGLQIRAQSTLQTTGGVTVRGAGTTVEAGGALRLDGEWIEDATVVFDSDLTIGSGSTLTYAYGFDMRSNPAIAVTGNLALPDVLTIELDALREANGFGVALFTYDTLDPVPDVRQWTVTGIPGCWVEHDPGNSRILVIRPPLATVIAIR